MGKKLKLDWVTDTIGDEYKQWTEGDSVFIKAQTGTGKSQFTKTRLVNHAEKNEEFILYICNRINLKRQVKIDLMKRLGENTHNIDLEELDMRSMYGNVKVTSYQGIQQVILDKEYGIENIIDYSIYKYVVMDEIHSIIQDASYNNHTIYFFNKFIKEYNPNTINIYISATMDVIKPMIDRIQESSNIGKTWEYTTGIDYTYLDVYYFKKIKDIVNTINNDKSESKWVIFVNTVNKGTYLEEKINDSAFICSEGNKKNKSKISEMERDSIINDSFFSCKCLITTKVLDNGINFEDYSLTNIVIMTLDKIDFIQMLGRKRIDINNAQQVKLYIEAKSIKTFTTIKNNIIKPIREEVKLFFEDKNEFRRKYNPNQDELGKYSNVFYTNVNNELNVNGVSYFTFVTQDWFCDDIIDKFKQDKESAFIKEQLSWIGHKYDKLNWVIDVVADEEINRLREYLDNVVDTKLFADEQKELTKLIMNELVTVGNGIDYRTKKVKPSTLERILRDDLRLEYAISKPIRETSNKDGKAGRRYIIISMLIK